MIPPASRTLQAIRASDKNAVIRIDAAYYSLHTQIFSIWLTSNQNFVEGQIDNVEKGDVMGQISFIDQIFGVASQTFSY